MRFMSIASGSSGNCIYVGSDNTHILIDVGISGKKVKEGLKKLDLKLSDLDAVFFTHEHTDHVSGSGVIVRDLLKSDIWLPCYGTQGTILDMESNKKLGDIPKDIFKRIDKSADIIIGDLILHPFSISHDAADPVGFTIRECENQDKKIGIATDLGTFNERIVDELKDSKAMLIEANHDIRMLQMGSYTYDLKRRVMSDKGHLSNEASGELISKLLHEGVNNILLGHLSKENNLKELAYETVKNKINSTNDKYKANDFNIEVASREYSSDIIRI